MSQIWARVPGPETRLFPCNAPWLKLTSKVSESHLQSVSTRAMAAFQVLWFMETQGKHLGSLTFRPRKEPGQGYSPTRQERRYQRSTRGEHQGGRKNRGRQGKSCPARVRGLAETLVNKTLWSLPRKGVALKSHSQERMSGFWQWLFLTNWGKVQEGPLQKSKSTPASAQSPGPGKQELFSWAAGINTKA